MKLSLLVNWFSKRRALQLEALDPAQTQETQLHKLLSLAKNTRFGKDHGFRDIQTISDFQSCVPLRRYEDFWKKYWEPQFPILDNVTWPGRIKYFAVSSGTTAGKTKHIPCSKAMIASNRRAALDVFAWHVLRHPTAKLFNGKSFMLGGSADLKQLAPQVREGDLSGIASATTPFWIRFLIGPDKKTSLIAAWEEKLGAMIKRVDRIHIRMLSGTPNWMLVFLEKMQERYPNLSPGELFPNLELIVHGGVSWMPYKPRFEAFFGEHMPITREVYPASEGFFATADRDDGEGLRLNLDIGLFFEFVPVDEIDKPNPIRHWIGNAETGRDYALVVSSCAGLWSYIVGDTVRFIETDPPRILMTGRLSYSLSLAGEHLIGEEIEKAILMAGQALKASVGEYCVGADPSETTGGKVGHLYVIETTGDPVKLGKLIDDYLKEDNEDYHALRSHDFVLSDPRVMCVPVGTLLAWMVSVGKGGGQHKMPRVFADQDRFQRLLEDIDVK